MMKHFHAAEEACTFAARSTFVAGWFDYSEPGSTGRRNRLTEDPETPSSMMRLAQLSAGSAQQPACTKACAGVVAWLQIAH